MVSHYLSNTLVHTTFNHLPEFLRPGDVLVINTSGTRKAALDAWREDGSHIKVHLSTNLRAEIWVIELRCIDDNGNQPLFGARPGEILRLPAGGSARILTPYQPNSRSRGTDKTGLVRLWLANLQLPESANPYLDRFGAPIRYGHIEKEWPIGSYQTVYATEEGSAEMPSAGRPFSYEIITRLVAQGVKFAPLILHTGVASLEAHEASYPEYFRVPPETAATINTAKARGNRIVAVGTTSVRAIETVTDESSLVHPGEGWTRLRIAPDRSLRIIDSLLTGFHEPKASHLELLSTLAGSQHLQLAYAEALTEKYLWHEFGDVHLIMP
jgi:S-adenosylmethionine:tRNA ribosyltransferase-isomerase